MAESKIKAGHYTNPITKKVERLSDIYSNKDKKKLKSELKNFIDNWTLEYNSLEDMSLPEQVEHFRLNIAPLEKIIHNMGFLSEDLKLFEMSDISNHKFYQPILSPREYSFLNTLIWDYETVADEKYLVSTTKEDMIEYEKITRQFLRKAFLNLEFKHIPITARLEFSQSDVSTELDRLLENPNLPISEYHLQMKSANKDKYATCRFRWIQKKFKDKLEISFEQLDVTLKNRQQLPIYALVKDITPYRYQPQKVHNYIQKKVYESFKKWFNKKYDKQFTCTLNMIGTKDCKVPHITYLDSDYKLHMKDEARLNKAYIKRIEESGYDKGDLEYFGLTIQDLTNPANVKRNTIVGKT